MIYLFYGSDVQKVRAKAFEWIAAAQKKEPNLMYTRLMREELTPAVLEEITCSGGLFVRRLLILLDDPFSAEFPEDSLSELPKGSPPGIPEYIDSLAASDNAIVLLAPKLTEANVKKIIGKVKVAYKYDDKYDNRIQTNAAAFGGRAFNTALVNALANRSCEKLWLEINRALKAGDAPEMILGLLHWKARDVMEKGSRVWRPDESRALSLNLIHILQSSRRGGLDLSLSLERLALSL